MSDPRESLPPEILERVREVRANRQAGIRRPRTGHQRPRLMGAAITEGEAKVLELVAEGLTDKDIASNLFLSLDTVKCHMKHMRKRIGVPNRTRLAVLYATGELAVVNRNGEPLIPREE